MESLYDVKREWNFWVCLSAFQNYYAWWIILSVSFTLQRCLREDAAKKNWYYEYLFIFMLFLGSY